VCFSFLLKTQGFKERVADVASNVHPALWIGVWRSGGGR
jgi:hypothetical protein